MANVTRSGGGYAGDDDVTEVEAVMEEDGVAEEHDDAGVTAAHMRRAVRRAAPCWPPRAKASTAELHRPVSAVPQARAWSSVSWICCMCQCAPSSSGPCSGHGGDGDDGDDGDAADALRSAAARARIRAVASVGSSGLATLASSDSAGPAAVTSCTCLRARPSQSEHPASALPQGTAAWRCGSARQR